MVGLFCFRMLLKLLLKVFTQVGPVSVPRIVLSVAVKAGRKGSGSDWHIHPGALAGGSPVISKGS